MEHKLVDKLIKLLILLSTDWVAYGIRKLEQACTIDMSGRKTRHINEGKISRVFILQNLLLKNSVSLSLSLSLSREIRDFSVEFIEMEEVTDVSSEWFERLMKNEQSNQKAHSIACLAMCSEEFHSVFFPKKCETLFLCNVIGALQLPL